MGTAAELNVLYRGLASHAVRGDVMELAKSRFVTASPSLAYESADTAVAEPDRAPDLGRDIPTTGSGAAAGPRPLGRRELLSGQVFEQSCQRSIDDFPQLSGRDGVSEQILGQA